MRRLRGERAIGVALSAMVLAACGAAGNNASAPSPTATPTAAATPATSPTPPTADVRLVIDDFVGAQVRLARLDATVTATVNGHYVGIVDGKVIVLDGNTLEALSQNGNVTKLGQLAATPDLVGLGTVVVNPQETEWLYAIRNDALTSTIHLGTPTSDRVVATLPAPDANSYYQPFAWNASGIYFVRQAVGLGGAHPFLEYHFPLAKFDVATDRVADVSPRCVALQVRDDGTMICGDSAAHGRVEVRSPSGQSNWIQVTIGTTLNGYSTSYVGVAVSPDNQRLIAGRNGSIDPVINYQMAVAGMTSSTASAFGPLDYLPQAWLPDGRVVALHQCVPVEWGGGPCDASVNGTYIFSADGTSHTLIAKLIGGDVVAYV